MKRVCCCFLLLSACAARGEMLTISSSTAPTEEGNVVMNDCSIHTNGAEWLNSVFVCELSAGEFYQPGHDVLDPEVLWTYDPERPIDSWLAPGVSYFDSEAQLCVVSPWDYPWNYDVDITFFSDLVDGKIPPWDGLAARFTFTDDAEGIWAFQVCSKGSNPKVYVGTVENGFMVVPEPGCFALFVGLAGLVFCRRQR